MPRYEYRSGSSNKFWEITVEGDTYTVQYGRIGTKGQTSVKSFADAATAQKKADAATKSKMKKGYVLVEDSGNDEAERLVEADALSAAGDPRGELIAVQHAIENASGKERAALKKQEAKLFADHPGLLGPLTGENVGEVSKVEWRMGFIDSLRLQVSYDHDDFPIVELLENILSHPSGARLQRLVLDTPPGTYDGEANWQEWLDVIAKVGAPELKLLQCGCDSEDSEISWCIVGNFSEALPKMPKLETLDLQGGGIDLPATGHPTLKKLVITSGGISGSVPRAIGAGDWPELTHLEVYLGTDDYGWDGSVDDCQGILQGEGLPKVAYLGLKNGIIMNELAEAVVTAPIVKRLKTLDLSMGTMNDEGAAALTKGAPALAGLQSLDVSDNFLSRDAVKALTGALSNCTAHGQKDAYEDGDDEPWYYTTVAE